MPILFVWMTLLVWVAGRDFRLVYFHDGMRWTNNLLSEAVLYLEKLFIQKTLKHFSLCGVSISATNVLNGFFSPPEKCRISSLFLGNSLPLPKIYVKKSSQNVIMKNEFQLKDSGDHLIVKNAPPFLVVQAHSLLGARRRVRISSSRRWHLCKGTGQGKVSGMP